MKIVNALKWAVKGDLISSNYTKQNFICKYGKKGLWEMYKGIKNNTKEVKN